MKLRTSLSIQFGMFALSLAISVFYALTLPDRVPTHWNIYNKVDQYGSKWVSVLMGPGMLLFCIGMTVVLPRISPKNFEIEKFTSTFAYVMLLVAALELYISVIIIKATAGAQLDMTRGMMAAMFVFFALIGNVMGKVRRNFFMGVRTPWTLASEPVWDATHRLAGRLWFVGGLVGAALALMGMPVVGSIAIILIMAFWPVVASYFLYKKLG